MGAVAMVRSVLIWERGKERFFKDAVLELSKFTSLVELQVFFDQVKDFLLQTDIFFQLSFSILQDDRHLRVVVIRLVDLLQQLSVRVWLNEREKFRPVFRSGKPTVGGSKKVRKQKLWKIGKTTVPRWSCKRNLWGTLQSDYESLGDLRLVIITPALWVDFIFVFLPKSFPVLVLGLFCLFCWSLSDAKLMVGSRLWDRLFQYLDEVTTTNSFRF